MSELVSLDSALRKKRRPPAPDRAAWLKGCILDERGRVIPNLANVLTALRAAPELASTLAYDEMLGAPILLQHLPVTPGGGPQSSDPPPRPLRDADVSQLQEFLQHSGMPKVGKDATHQAVDQRAQERAFHPVRDYLRDITWDGVNRLDSWMVSYLGAEESHYSSRIGRMFLVAMVARILEPGCKSDHIIVLEGDQGVGKSTACGVLAGEWFSDSLPDIRDKDGAQHIRGKWLVEIAELAAIGKAEAETLKSFISRQVERYRPSYGRKEVIEPRQCVFVGTTNREAYLKDETGARRFWPVRVGEVDVRGLQNARDQLFAEAVAAYKAREPWWPDRAFEQEHIKPQQRGRYETDPWETAITEFITPLSRVRIEDIARDALHIESVARIGTQEQRRIASVLVDKGWKASRDWRGRFFSPPPKTMTHDAP